jgi:5'-nucleotidase
MSKNLILITNDDGYNADGIIYLKKALDDLGETFVVAPHYEKSGTSHALTLNDAVRIRSFGDNVYSVTGFPADCVYAGINGILKRKPDLIVSGINKGANIGLDMYYSGTVAGVRQGIIDGVAKGFSVSLAAEKNGKDFFWEDAAAFSKKLAEKLLNSDYKGAGFLNLNYPNISSEKIKGVKVTRMGSLHYVQEVQKRLDPRGGEYFWLWGGYSDSKQDEDTDINAIKEGYISITPSLLDITDYNGINAAKNLIL